MTLSSLATQFIAAVRECGDMDAELREKKRERDALEQQLLEAFRNEGIQSIRTNDGLAYLRRDLWASLTKSPENLRGTSLEWLIKDSVNQQTLSATVRELPRDEEDLPILPEEVKELIKVTEVYKVGVRQS